jgi:hypothetical protein
MCHASTGNDRPQCGLHVLQHLGPIQMERKRSVMNGKGSKARPLAVKSDEFASNWDVAFGLKKKAKKATSDVKETPPKR